MSKLLVGWAEESIVPEKNVNLAGQFYERISSYVESEITVTAMAIESDGEQAILVSCDVVSLPENLLALARKKFDAYNLDIDSKKIIVNATHTHTSHKMAMPVDKSSTKSPAFSEVVNVLNEFLPPERQYTALVTPDANVLTPAEAGDFVTDKIALAAKKAWENRKRPFILTNLVVRLSVCAVEFRMTTARRKCGGIPTLQTSLRLKVETTLV